VPARSEGTECGQRNSQRLSHHDWKNCRAGLPDAGGRLCLRTGRPRQLRLWRAYWIRSLWSLTLSFVVDQTNCRPSLRSRMTSLGRRKKSGSRSTSSGRIFVLLTTASSGRWPKWRLRRGQGRRLPRRPRIRAGAGTPAFRCCPWQWRRCAAIRCVLFALWAILGIAG
jgi:hypothetical protein